MLHWQKTQTIEVSKQDSTRNARGKFENGNYKIVGVRREEKTRSAVNIYTWQCSWNRREKVRRVGKGGVQTRQNMMSGLP